MYQDHPAVLMWGVGNEWSYNHTNPKVFDALEDAARMIHEIDPHHPTMTANGDNPFDEEFIELFKKKCPSIDVLGVNVYKGLLELPERLRRFGWEKPYCVTEWGPTGHWQVPKTEWKVPIEETSSEKAIVYKQRYEGAIKKDTQMCIGSYVFMWDQKQERTHTWYGMFVESGEKTEAVNVMRYLWRGEWPENRAPVIDSLQIDGKAAIDNVYLEPGERHFAKVEVREPDGDSLSIGWEFLLEPKVFGYGGRGEKKPDAVPDLIKERTKKGITFDAPEREGPYRLFVYVFDGEGNAATANIPFYVKQ